MEAGFFVPLEIRRVWGRIDLSLSWWKSLSYRTQSIDLQRKSMDLFIYDRDLRHERVKGLSPNFASHKWKENRKRKRKFIKRRAPRKYFSRSFLLSNCFSWCFGTTAFYTQPRFWTQPHYGVKDKGLSPNFISNSKWI